MLKLSFKQVYFICFLVACFFLGLLVWLQYWYITLPCPLGQIEKIIILVLAIIFLIIVLYRHTKSSRKVWSLVALVVSLLGVLAAGRHVWLQRYSMGEIGINGFMEQSQPSSFVHYLYQAMNSSLCAQTQWSALGISLAAWTLILFILFALVCGYQVTIPVVLQDASF